MILIITHKQDYTADFLIDKLNKGKIPYYRFNCEEIASIPYSYRANGKMAFEINGHSQFKSVWFRRTKLPIIDQKLDASYKAYFLLEYQALLENMFQSIETERWLSHPDFIYKAENKVLQLRMAVQCGFQTPATIITNNRQQIVQFASDYSDNVIIKPLSSGRVKSLTDTKLLYTNIVRKEHLQNIETFDITPFIVQNNIQKDYELRVTVVNGKVFAAKVNSQENQLTLTDWRRQKMQFFKYDLPVELEVSCLKIVESLNLSFGAIDIIKGKDGSYYFLEINPNGQWAWIEKDTTMNISGQIIDFLNQ